MSEAIPDSCAIASRSAGLRMCVAIVEQGHVNAMLRRRVGAALSGFPGLKRLLRRFESRVVRLLATAQVAGNRAQPIVRSPRVERVVADLERERRRRSLPPGGTR